MRLLLVLGFCLPILTFAQTKELEFKNYVLKLNKQAFAFAGGWSIGNLAYSSTEFILLSYNDPKNSEALARAQMNMGWSAINTAIFGLGYWQQSKLAKKEGLNWYQEQRKMKNLFLINSALDIAYIGAGYLINRSTKGDVAQNRGFGQAIMFQGSFLLAFDSFMWLKHRRLSRSRRNVDH